MPPIPNDIAQQFENDAIPLPTLLTVHFDYVTAYYQDTIELAQLAMQPKVSLSVAGAPNDPTNPFYNMFPLEVVADIVQINDDTNVKGMYLSKNSVSLSSTNPTVAEPTRMPISAGEMISDTSIIGFRQDVFKILYPDPLSTTGGTMEIGSITASGTSGKPMSPGQPPQITGGDWAITGGTGAFWGVTGQAGGENKIGSGKIRAASVTEDPSKRRFNASPSGTYSGGTGLYVLPLFPPQVIAVLHANGMPVKNGQPANAGEQLTLYATGLGPVRDAGGNAVQIGTTFLANMTVIAPVTVTIGGTPVTVVTPDPIASPNVQGVAGFNNGYSVVFQMPAAPSGTTTIQVSSAWIQSAGVPFFVA